MADHEEGDAKCINCCGAHNATSGECPFFKACFDKEKVAKLGKRFKRNKKKEVRIDEEGFIEA